MEEPQTLEPEVEPCEVAAEEKVQEVEVEAPPPLELLRRFKPKPIFAYRLFGLVGDDSPPPPLATFAPPPEPPPPKVPELLADFWPDEISAPEKVQ